MRPWVKIRMTPTDISYRAAAIIARWKRARSAASSIARAIVIYDALMSGDVEPLFEQFPLLFSGGRSASSGVQYVSKSIAPPPEVVYAEQTEEEIMAAFAKHF